MELHRNAEALEPTDDFPELDAHAVANAPALGLTEVERRSVEALVTGRPGVTASFVGQRAAALATDTAGDVRRRSLARAVATQEAILSQLNLLLVSSVARKDADATRLLDRALNGATSRFALLVAELRADHSAGRRTVVQVGIANSVTVSGEKVTMPALRRRPYQDELTKIPERQLREALGDAWRTATSVTLTIGSAVTEVALVDLPCAQTFGGTKRWLRCPSCARKVMTLAAFGTSWSCASCGRWAWRDRGRLLRESQRGSGTPARQVSHDAEAPCCP